MQLTPVATATTSPSFDPGQPTLPGLEPDVVAMGADHRGELNVRIVVDRARPIDLPKPAGFDDALRAANQRMVADRRDARWGFFGRHEGRVDAIALVQAGDGIDLVRVNQPLDRYTEPVPGQMFPGQNWTRSGIGRAERATPATLALVGADGWIDLRPGTPADVTPFADD